MQNLNLIVIFLTGLTTGGLSCLAIQGGLLTSVIAREKGDIKAVIPVKTGIHKSSSYIPIFSFLLGKLLIHTLLGFFLGGLGQTLVLSPITRGWIQIVIGIYLVGVAGSLLELHPLFRYFIITPPKFLARLARNEAKSKSLFAPFILGLTTVFIPCAVTQATSVIAIGTGNPLYGAAVMLAFTLGTSPTFLIFGFLLNSSAKIFQKYFPRVAATALFGMSLYSINAGIGLTGSPYTFQNFLEAAGSTPSSSYTAILGDKFQTVTINVNNTGYSPSNINLKLGIPAKIILKTINVESCSRAFTIPGLNIQKLLPPTGEAIVEFTPTKLGTLAFSCSMGMYTGKFNIIN